MFTCYSGDTLYRLLQNLHFFKPLFFGKYEIIVKQSILKLLSRFSFGIKFFKSDIVFLGGSFTKNGGHNPIEAARAQCAIITGPNVFNWQNLYEEMNENKACYMIKKPKELEVIISKFIENNNLLTNYKNNALNYSNKTFFEEQKLIEILNKSLENHA